MAQRTARRPRHSRRRCGVDLYHALVSRAAGSMSSDAQPRKSHYPLYVLILCLFVYISSTADRQILAVLAQSVKHDLGVSDADMGFLLGTAFAVFYAVFGVPAGRLGDL